MTMTGLTKSQRLFLGIIILLLVDIIWVASSELTEYLFKDENYSKPFFSTYIKTSMFMIYLLGFIAWKPWRDQCTQQHVYKFVDPNSETEEDITCGVDNEPLLSEPMWIPIKYHDGVEKGSGTESDDSCAGRGSKAVRFSKLTEVRQLSESQAEDAMLARLSYVASVRAKGIDGYSSANKLTVKSVAKLAFTFSILWFGGNLSYQEALATTDAGVVNVLSCSSSLFTLVLAGVFPSNSNDHFTLSKLIAVFVSIIGVVLVTASDEQRIHSYFPMGATWSLFGALFYAFYIVHLQRRVENEDRLDIPMFFGFVGLFNFILLWPSLFIIHYLKFEEFQWPTSHQWALIIANGLIGTVFSEILWLWGCFLTSSLIGTLAISLTVPLTILFDIVLKKVHYHALFFLGSSPMFLSFFAVALLAHYDNRDPVLENLYKLVRYVCRRKRTLRIREMDREQTESLISINSEYT